MTKCKNVTRLKAAACENDPVAHARGLPEGCRRPRSGVESAGWRGRDTGFAFEPVFRVSVPASDGTAFNLETDRFEFLVEHYGFQPSDFGREFRTGSERFRITGVDPRRPGYPSSAKRIPDRRGFEVTAENAPCFSRKERADAL